VVMPTAQNNISPPPTGLLVSGMTCSNCARRVTEAVQSVPGVHSATVNLDAARVTVRWDAAAEANVPAVLAAVKRAGYGVKLVETAAPGHGRQRPSGWQSNLWIGVLGTLPLVVGEWIFGWGMAHWFQWFSFAVAGAVQVLAGARFYRGAWHQFKAGSSNMDTLVALGSTTAFGFSAWVLFKNGGGHVYFMEAAAIITLISVGHWLEARMSARAARALKSLLQLAPQTARRIVSSRSSRREEAQTSSSKNEQSLLTSAATSEEEVPVTELKVGDLVSLRPGDHVPTDGEVIAGDSTVDEAMLTGESAPVDKSVGSTLYAGTMNLNGRLVLRVTATGEATALAHIIAAVQRAQTSRANIQRLGDRVSNVFVPAVIGVALATALWWVLLPAQAWQLHNWLAQFLWAAHPPELPVAAAFVAAAAVLIVACPCAMGLATPAAIMAGANAAARRGILIRDGVALEKAGEITAVIFDKTGTLTLGRPEVEQIVEVQSPTPNAFGVQSKVQRLAAALARHSTHPVSQAIAKISVENVEVTNWQEIRGAGVVGNIELRTPNSELRTQTARLGSLRWLREGGVDLAAGERFIAEWSAQGATIIGLALDQSLQGLFAVKDTVKPNADRVIGQLQRGGLKTFLVTGDNPLTAASIARQVGIAAENVFAEVRPEQKAEFVKQLQQRGERVAFVGDGINDAPALEQADLGVAVSRASDVAREAADVILLNSEIEAVPEALGLARATLRTIKQNLFWAFFYNAAAVPLAALGFMNPVLCAAAMGLSDLVVIGNALRLGRWSGGRRG
jgi:P-type Cu+ transporter